jgi:predicted Zn-dependent protease
MTQDFKSHFESIANFVFSELRSGERAALSYSAESSSFMRFNNCRVRQNGAVEQIFAGLTLWRGAKTYSVSFVLTGESSADYDCAAGLVGEARAIMSLLPDDPFQAIPDTNDKSESRFKGDLIPQGEIPARVLGPAEGLDFTGIYSQGQIYRGTANSQGAKHWFETETFLVDYSVWLSNGRAVKSSYAGSSFSDKEYIEKIADARRKLTDLQKPEKVLEPGQYRAFITPTALGDVNAFFSWNGFGERGLRQGESAYLALREGRESFSPLFSLSQDFTLGVQPAFNDIGELAPECLSLVENGKMTGSIISSRTAKQYNLKANGADDYESVRSVSIKGGDLPEADALKALGTGVYVSNFHYLNWSDVQSARVTGMTRFSCLWVENGVVCGPIKDMRWDESLYNMLGAKLERLTKERELLVENSTYEQREVGGCLIPGILVNGLNFTL